MRIKVVWLAAFALVGVMKRRGFSSESGVGIGLRRRRTVGDAFRWVGAGALVFFSFESIGRAAAQGPAVAKAETATRVAAARKAVSKHAEALRLGLLEALRTGGPRAAVGACTSISPDTDATVTEQTGFEIGRTALRIRNPENAPDAWEKSVLEDFLRQIAAGGDAKIIERFDIQVTSDGQSLFRYMRPIMMGEACLACHGPAIAQDVRAEIVRTYNDDKAVGFNLGDMRGAFSLVQVVD